MHLPFPCHRVAAAPTSRREFLAQFGGIGALAMAWMAPQERAVGLAPTASSLAHHVAKAKHVIQLFMIGGASQCDTFDYKPELIKRHGETVNFTVTGGTAASPGPLLKSPWEWKQHGECGKWVTS